MAGVPTELLPYLVGAYNEESGEWAMRCPRPEHEDTKRSASLNVPKGTWYCFGCGEGGRVEKLVEEITSGESRGKGPMAKKEKSSDKAKLSERDVRRYHKFLMGRNFRDERHYLTDERGLTVETLKRYTIGYNPGKGVYTLPVYDETGRLVNIRQYDRDPKPGFPKMYSMMGHGRPSIYPVEHFEEFDGPIGVVEGEWDALLTTQEGFPCVTRTGAADVWHREWNYLFDGRQVWTCHDMDDKGQKANSLVRNSLAEDGIDVDVIHLPYEVTEDHGKDLSDYWLNGGSPDEFNSLRDGGPRWDFRVVDSLSGDHLGKPGRMEVRVVGVGSRSFLTPKHVLAACGRDQEDICEECPMLDLGGRADFEVPASSPRVLAVLYGGAKAERSLLLEHAPVNWDCPSLRFQVDTSHTVQKLFVAQAIDEAEPDHMVGDDARHFSTLRQVHAVGIHDAMSNTTLDMTGSVQVNPKDHGNEFVAWGVRKVETSIDKFELSDDDIGALDIMFSAPPGKVGSQLGLIADDMAEHVTHIYGRRNMHILMDLAFHSVLAFDLGREEVRKGWLDVIVVGETRTGKSEAATRLVQNYRSGSVISCESASLAGVLGGVQQLGSSEWVVTWGVVPFNDQRLVVLDEVSGLSPDEIGALSSLRSSGIAELTKIKAEKALARTRLIWIGNPRRPNAHYTTGMHMLEDLVPKPEDIARFDLAMSVHTGEPGTERANEYRAVARGRVFDDDMLRKLLMWAWSRRREHVIFENSAIEAVYDAAKELGGIYTERPPLIQAANARTKVARVAAAIAARTFSTLDGVHLVVRPDHVRVAVKFMRALYDNEKFGYGDESRFIKERQQAAIDNWEEAKRLLLNNRALTAFLRSATDQFSTLELRNSAQYPDIAMAINDAGALWQWGFLDSAGVNYVANRQLVDLLKEVPR